MQPDVTRQAQGPQVRTEGVQGPGLGESSARGLTILKSVLLKLLVQSEVTQRLRLGERSVRGLMWLMVLVLKPLIQ